MHMNGKLQGAVTYKRLWLGSTHWNQAISILFTSWSEDQVRETNFSCAKKVWPPICSLDQLWKEMIKQSSTKNPLIPVANILMSSVDCLAHSGLIIRVITTPSLNRWCMIICYLGVTFTSWQTLQNRMLTAIWSRSQTVLKMTYK